MLFCCFFFFKQKTAYDMRISDWSSDVCSSDLRIVGAADRRGRRRRQLGSRALGVSPSPRPSAARAGVPFSARPYRSNGMPAFAGMTIIALPPAQLQAALHDGAAGHERRSPGGGTTLQLPGRDPAVAQGEGCIALTVIIAGCGDEGGR